MLNSYRAILLISIMALLVPSVASATARLVSVTPVGGGCVSGPTGPSVQAWDVEQGETYTVTIADVFECANGGTDPTVDMRVNSTNHGNTDVVATLVEPGVYEFDFTVPADGSCTLPIFYCTTPGAFETGIFVVRDDGAPFQAHLRVSEFDVGCTNPTEILAGVCAPIENESTSWGTLKSHFD